MKSLQQQDVADRFAVNCLSLWKDWLKPADQAQMDLSGSRLFCRKAALQAAVRELARGVMRCPAVEIRPLPNSWGCFLCGEWKLQLNETFLKEDGIVYSDFLEVCRTAFHEARHAEQYYRVAQGLALGAIAFPDTSPAQLVHQAGVGGGVAAKVAAFKTAKAGVARRVVAGMDPAGRARVIAELLKMPLDAARDAEASRDEFNEYLGLPPPDWFKRGTAKPEVEDWMRSNYKKTLSEMDAFAQDHHLNPSMRLKAMYKALPEEIDAHAIEEMAADAITQRIGRPSSRYERRTDTALFGP